MMNRKTSMTWLMSAAMAVAMPAAFSGEALGQQNQNQQTQRSQQSQQHSSTIRGTVQNLQRTQHMGETHLHLTLRNQQGQTRTIDLGPAQANQNLMRNLSRGDQISVTGKTVFLARSINHQGQQYSVNWQQPDRQQYGQYDRNQVQGRNQFQDQRDYGQSDFGQQAQYRQQNQDLRSGTWNDRNLRQDQTRFQADRSGYGDREYRQTYRAEREQDGWFGLDFGDDAEQRTYTDRQRRFERASQAGYGQDREFDYEANIERNGREYDVNVERETGDSGWFDF